jgi:hypothetical protein
MLDKYIYGADAILLVYDVTNFSRFVSPIFALIEEMSISLTSYVQLFQYFHFGIAYFWPKEIASKAFLKMLVNLAIFMLGLEYNIWVISR